MIERFERVSRAATRAVAALAVFLILLAAAITVVDVFMRSIVGSPIFGTNDVVLLLLTVAVAGCFPYALAVGQHMEVTLIGRAMGSRGFWTLSLFGNLVTLVVFAGFCLEFAKRAANLGDQNAGTQLLRIPLMPFWWIAAGLLALGVIAQTAVVAAGFVSLLRRMPVPRDSIDGST
jgi:TRAP-type C4-dicarboxylate transport system permease small subunit